MKKVFSVLLGILMTQTSFTSAAVAESSMSALPASQTQVGNEDLKELRELAELLRSANGSVVPDWVTSYPKATESDIVRLASVAGPIIAFIATNVIATKLRVPETHDVPIFSAMILGSTGLTALTLNELSTFAGSIVRSSSNQDIGGIIELIDARVAAIEKNLPANSSLIETKGKTLLIDRLEVLRDQINGLSVGRSNQNSILDAARAASILAILTMPFYYKSIPGERVGLVASGLIATFSSLTLIQYSVELNQERTQLVTRLNELIMALKRENQLN